MAFCDFVVKFDQEKDTDEEITRRIFFSLFIKRIKADKPVIIFIAGKSGEGKSLCALRLEEILAEIQGYRMEEHLEQMNVFVPMEYPTKLDAMLHNKAMKEINIICMHEAREVIKAKLWHSFVTQAIADINAMSRKIKKIITIIISQDITDITREMRKTITYYCEVRRPIGKAARMTIYTTWLNKQDLERPKLAYRKISGYLVKPDGTYMRHCPDYFVMSKPKKETIDKFDILDTASKSGIIKSKLSKLLEEMKKDVGEESHKLQAMVEFYTKDPQNIHLIGKRYRNKWKLHPDAIKAHGLEPFEEKQFEEMFTKKLEELGVLDEQL